jgi:sugar lactone lactonase YvrE
MRIKNDGSADPILFDTIDTFCGKAQVIALDTTTVYWARNFGVQKKLKSGAGSVVTLSSTGTAPFGVAADDSFVYWTSQTSQLVTRSDKTGTVKDNISATSGLPKLIAVDALYVYWATDTAVLKHDKSSVVGDPTPLLSNLGAIGGLAGDPTGDAVYVVDTGAGKIVRVPKDVGLSEQTIATSQDELSGVAVDDTFVYWTDTTTGEILRTCK